MQPVHGASWVADACTERRESAPRPHEAARKGHRHRWHAAPRGNPSPTRIASLPVRRRGRGGPDFSPSKGSLRRGRGRNRLRGGLRPSVVRRMRADPERLRRRPAVPFPCGLPFTATLSSASSPCGVWARSTGRTDCVARVSCCLPPARQTLGAAGSAGFAVSRELSRAAPSLRHPWLQACVLREMRPRIAVMMSGEISTPSPRTVPPTAARITRARCFR